MYMTVTELSLPREGRIHYSYPTTQKKKESMLMTLAEQYLLCYAYLNKVIYCSKPRMLLVEIPSLWSFWLYLYSHLMLSGSSPINTLLANPFPPPPLLSQIKCQSNKLVLKIVDTLISTYAKYYQLAIVFLLLLAAAAYFVWLLMAEKSVSGKPLYLMLLRAVGAMERLFLTSSLGPAAWQGLPWKWHIQQYSPFKVLCL